MCVFLLFPPGFQGAFVFVFLFLNLSSMLNNFREAMSTVIVVLIFRGRGSINLLSVSKGLGNSKKFEAFSMHSLWISSYFGVKFSPEFHFHLASLPKCATVITNQISSSLLAPALAKKYTKTLVFQCPVSVSGVGCPEPENLYERLALAFFLLRFSSVGESDSAASETSLKYLFLPSPPFFISVHFFLLIV